MKNKLIRFDWAIKNILRNKANFDILEGFISEVLSEDIKILKILESEGNQDDSKVKYNRVDILVESTTGEYLIVEVQNDTELDFFHRVLYGASKLITEYLELGEPYSKVKKVISISIVYFNLGKGLDYVYRGCTNFEGLHQKDPLNLSPRQKDLFQKEKVEDIFPEHYLIKPDSFKSNIHNTLDEWVYFLKNSEVLPSFTAKGIQQAGQALDILKLSKEDKRKYKRYLEDLSYEASISETVHFEANQRIEEVKKAIEEQKIKIFEKGKEEGKDEEKIRIAQNLLQNNVPIEIIMASTGLSKEEIEQLK